MLDLHEDAATDPGPDAPWDPDSFWDRGLGDIRVVFGAGRLAELGELAAEIGGRRALLVTDPGLVAAGHAASACAALRIAGLEVELFDAVSPNPTTREVEAGTEIAAERPIDLIVALGGGSAMDCAKGINFLLTNGGRMEDYWGFGKATKRMLPSIGVPTTAGTGSDAQSYALISQAETHRKMACGDPKARFRVVILDPALLATIPRRVAATTGMDALSHALESYVTSVRTPASASLSRRAFRLLEPVVEAAAQPPASTEVASRALLGAHLAGAAIEGSMLGAAHAAANALTASQDVAHGEAIGLMLPSVIRFNTTAVDALYGELWPDGAGAGLADRIEEIRRRTGLPTQLGDFGIEAPNLPSLAAAACDERTANFNPRPVDQNAFEEIYAGAL
ncbi:MAG: iron-containing alcohol dehydrogenase [Acidobacteria bacterium]|nr:iron-containing alcohol dehydrogenase [Acidobacteriota bacterium]